jgi:hypothetical protein
MIVQSLLFLLGKWRQPNLEQPIHKKIVSMIEAANPTAAPRSRPMLGR